MPHNALDYALTLLVLLLLTRSVFAAKEPGWPSTIFAVTQSDLLRMLTFELSGLARLYAQGPLE